MLYVGLAVLGGGAILGGLELAAIGAFVIDRKFAQAAGFATAGAALSFFGFLHGEAIGVAHSPAVAAARTGAAPARGPQSATLRFTSSRTSGFGKRRLGVMA